MRERTDIAFRIGVGRVEKIRDMESSYRDAVNALLLTTNTVAHADDLPIGCEYSENYPVDIERKIFAEVEKGRTEAALNAAKEYFEYIRGGDIMDIRLKILEFALRAEHISYSSGGMVYNISNRRDYLPTLMGIDDTDSLWNWLSDRLVFSCRNISTKREESSNDAIEAAKKYIENNYTDNITLEDVSREVNISSYYLSRIFKEGTGENFIDYLTGLRMDKAKELLATTQLSMKEICAKVGYSDPNYFSKTFKKNVGVTPTEYREGK